MFQKPSAHDPVRRSERTARRVWPRSRCGQDIFADVGLYTELYTFPSARVCDWTPLPRAGPRSHLIDGTAGEVLPRSPPGPCVRLDPPPRPAGWDPDRRYPGETYTSSPAVCDAEPRSTDFRTLPS